jgi:hypothetical protein
MLNYDSIWMLLATTATSISSFMALFSITKRKKARIAVRRHRPEP